MQLDSGKEALVSEAKPMHSIKMKKFGARPVYIVILCHKNKSTILKMKDGLSEGLSSSPVAAQGGIRHTRSPAFCAQHHRVRKHADGQTISCSHLRYFTRLISDIPQSAQRNNIWISTGLIML